MKPDFDPSKPLADAQHERFAQFLAEGRSQLEAYTKAGYSPNDGNATRLKSNERVLQRVNWLKEQAAKRCVLTLERKRQICFEIAETGENRDRLNAIKVDNDLAGDGSEANKQPIVLVKIGGFDDEDD